MQFLCGNFCLITKFRNKYLDLYKFAIFLQFIEVIDPKGLIKNLSNVIDLYLNKKIEGGPPQAAIQ